MLLVSGKKKEQKIPILLKENTESVVATIEKKCHFCEYRYLELELKFIATSTISGRKNFSGFVVENSFFIFVISPKTFLFFDHFTV